MSGLDYVVLCVTLAAIAGYGVWKTRGDQSLQHYLRGDERTRWGTIGLSVLATQASAITFLSAPGQAYENGIGFVQNYFGQPLALIVVCIFFIPAYQRLKVYTAYEYLGQRFDQKTRLLGAGLFLIQRGLATGITIYAPAIVVSALVGWNLNLTILLVGGLVILYTTTGGSSAVNITQKIQLSIILVGMCAAFWLIIARLPGDISFTQAVQVAGKFGKLEAVDISLSPGRTYTVWSGILGAFFLQLSYFGADQTQVQRYLSGGSVTESRLGLLFLGLVKVPMQFFILFIGVMLFVFYQFEAPPIDFNRPAYQVASAGPDGPKLAVLQGEYQTAFAAKQAGVRQLVAALRAGDAAAVLAARDNARRLNDDVAKIRARVRKLADPPRSPNESDFVFLTFVLDHLPRGLVGLLVAVIFCAAMSAASAGLTSLSSSAMIDFYRPLLQPAASDAHYLFVSRIITVGWGVLVVAVALFAHLVRSLIEAGNILGSLFYGSTLGLFLTAFLLRRVRADAVFYAGLIVQALVLISSCIFSIGYLWYNLIGCVGVMGVALLLQSTIFSAKKTMS